MIAPNTAEFPRARANNWLPLLLWKSRWLLAFTTVLGLCGGFVFLQLAPKSYESTAQVLVMRRGVDITGLQAGQDKIGYHQHVDVDEFVTQMLIIRSPDVVRQAVKIGELDQLQQFNGLEDPTWSIIAGIEVTRGLQKAHDAKVLNLHYSGENPEACQRIVQSIVQSYRNHLNSIYDDVSGQTLRLITKARDDLHQQLVNKEAAYLEFRKDAPIFNTASQESKTLHEGSLLELAKSRAQIYVRQAELQAHIKSIQAAASTGDSRQAVMLMLTRTGATASNDAQMATVYERELLTLEIEEQLLLEQYGGDHPIVAAQQRKIKAIEKFMQRRKLLGRRSSQFDEEDTEFIPIYLGSKQHELRELKALEHEINIAFQTEQVAAQSAVVFTIQDTTLRQEIDRIKALYEQTLAQLERISLVKDYGGYYTQLITPPSIGALAWPRPHFAFAFGAIAGTLLGVSIALLAKFLSKGFRDAATLEAETGLEVLGQIPALPRHKLKAGQSVSTSLVVQTKPQSVGAESFRATRTSLLFGTRIDGPRVIHFAAPQSGVDVTAIVANLGITLAKAGRRVLLVDTNFAKPMLQELFSCSAENGLRDLRAGEVQYDQVVLDTGLENLRLLPAGNATATHSEVFSLKSFEQLLSDLRHSYDYILIDSAPLLESTDAATVAASVDSVVLVSRTKKTPRASLNAAIEICDRVGANVIGVVLTSVPNDQLRIKQNKPKARPKVTAKPAKAVMPKMAKPAAKV